VRLAEFRDLAPDFPLEAGEHEACQRVSNAATQKVGVGVPLRHEQFLGDGLHLVRRPVDPHLEQLGPFSSIDCERPVGGHPLHMLGIVEIVAKVLLVLGQGLALALDALALELRFP